MLAAVAHICVPQAWHQLVDTWPAPLKFAAMFPWIDRLFGTLHLPASAWPTRYGTHTPVPLGLLDQLRWPVEQLIWPQQR
jgi:sterol desaturase/sphingolipid hydroxylase (fatty acid hydroxylase superfamily)